MNSCGAQDRPEPSLQLALGPILYYWSRPQVLEFYASMMELPVDIIYLGEAVCARRHALRTADWISLARDLAASGKQVVLSTQSLLEGPAEMAALRALAATEFALEVNDYAALVERVGRPWVAGPHLNVYSSATLDWLSGLGVQRVTLPIEGGRTLARQLHRSHPEMPLEVLAWGLPPLAFSARCFTARHHGLPKDDCQFRCGDDPQGLPLATREGAPFLVLNGIQTLGGHVHALCDLPDLQQSGITVLRLSPQLEGMSEVVRCFDALRHGRCSRPEAEAALLDHAAGPLCHGYWHGQPGMAWQGAAASAHSLAQAQA